VRPLNAAPPFAVCHAVNYTASALNDSQDTLTLSAARHIQAAEGWLDLGDWRSANEEPENVPARLRAHPSVLEMRFRVYSMAKHLELALEVAEAVVALTPHEETAWINRSYVLHDMKRTQEAYDQLLPALERFEEECTIPYNLACYACQLGDHAHAKELLALAYERGDANEIKLMALDDPDLAPLWRSSSEKA
jgi:predicted Zn-dependent protease